MSLAGIRDAIKVALENISGVTAYDTVPESLPSSGFPAAIVVPARGTYHQTFDGQIGHQMEIVLLVGQVPGLSRAAQEALDLYMAESGDVSVVAAVEAATLTTHADDIQVTGYRDYGIMEFNGQSYMGVKFDVTVWT
jgi:ethanolamine ammonia-lyase small subunit